MDTLITFLTSLGPQHWLVFGLILLIAEMASGTTYLLWPAVAAFITALISLSGGTTWVADMAIFAVLVIALTWFGRPIVQRWRHDQEAWVERGAVPTTQRHRDLAGHGQALG